jgi:cobalt-zinc-cadmium efflux system membrane fusion protein
MTGRGGGLRCVAAVAVVLALAGCGASRAPDQTAAPAVAPPVEQASNATLIQVAHPEQIPLATAGTRRVTPELKVTGVVSTDVARAVPVVSLASGRIVEVHARLGDQVSKGQVLVRIQSADVSEAISAYRKAVSDEAVAHGQFDRAKRLYDRGAIAQKDLEAAQGEADKARADVDAAAEHVRVLGAKVTDPASGMVDVVAPIAGVITDQTATAAGGVKSLDNSPNLFVISDLSEVWILCDVYENDLSTVRLGDQADIHLNAYPDRALTGRISDIGHILDPNTRTAKVRLEVRNPGFLRIGMFVAATFRGQATVTRVVVPVAAVLHLHDRDWVFVPADGGRFRRVEVTTGQTFGDNMQEILDGIAEGQRIVSNALVLQGSVE